MAKKTQLYDLQYIVNGRVKETVMYASSARLCNWKANELRKGAYKLGTFKKVKNG